MLADVTTVLEDVQKDLLEIIHSDEVLIGHSLEFDLRALKVWNRIQIPDFDKSTIWRKVYQVNCDL